MWGEWSEERHAALTAELDAQIAANWKEAVAYGTRTEVQGSTPI